LKTDIIFILHLPVQRPRYAIWINTN